MGKLRLTKLQRAVLEDALEGPLYKRRDGWAREMRMAVPAHSFTVVSSLLRRDLLGYWHDRCVMITAMAKRKLAS